jgi:hypothetical protein
LWEGVVSGERRERGASVVVRRGELRSGYFLRCLARKAASLEFSLVNIFLRESDKTVNPWGLIVDTLEIMEIEVVKS